MKHIIFDWSGTVVDDLPPVIEATNAALQYAGRPAMDRETFRRRFKLPYTEFYAEESPHVPLEELEIEFRRAFAASQEPVTILDASLAFLEQAQLESRRMFVLSSAPAQAVVAQAHTLGIHHFSKPFMQASWIKSLHSGTSGPTFPGPRRTHLHRRHGSRHRDRTPRQHLLGRRPHRLRLPRGAPKRAARPPAPRPRPSGALVE